MAEQNRRLFKVKVKDEDSGTEKELELEVHRPSIEEIEEAQQAFNRSFSNAVKSDAILRFEVEKYLRERKQWDDEKDSKFKEVSAELDRLEKQLSAGGMKLLEGRKLALKIKKTRTELSMLNSHRLVLDQNTAEGQAENSRFSRLVSLCLVYPDSGKPYYKDLNDYLQHAGDEVAQEGARQFAMLQYGLDPQHEQKLAENKFLIKYGFMDEKLRLIRKSDRKLVDENFNLVNEQGLRVNEDGQRINTDGSLISEDGNLVPTEVKPFLDDDTGNPIVE
jgi:hypothetical protein